MNDLTLGKLFELAGCSLTMPAQEEKKNGQKKRKTRPFKIQVVYPDHCDPKAAQKGSDEIAKILADSIQHKAKIIYDMHQNEKIKLPELPEGMVWSEHRIFDILSELFLDKLNRKIGKDYLQRPLLRSSQQKKTIECVLSLLNERPAGTMARESTGSRRRSSRNCETGTNAQRGAKG